jgi:hypothetical protein
MNQEVSLALLEELAEVMGVDVSEDAEGDPVIRGQSGCIRAAGAGFLIRGVTERRRATRLAAMTFGLPDGAFLLPRMPNELEGAVLAEVIGAARREGRN